MSESSQDSDDKQGADAHLDKYNDPRVRITKRGIAIGIIIVLLGIVGAAASIYQRKTKLEKTTEFWGKDVITALQLGERVQLSSVSGKEFETVELARMPGLGHLRRLLLDERNYDGQPARTASSTASVLIKILIASDFGLVTPRQNGLRICSLRSR